tara:strand:- start:3100 stop:3306 length:207 start_codon:yes stop_codon:yes gene_type:complete
MAYDKCVLQPFPMQEDVRKDIARKAEKLPKFIPEYRDMTPPERKKKAIAIASDNGRCWWIAQHLELTI